MKKFVAMLLGSILILALSLTTALAAHTHTWGAWAWEKKPTCISEGRQVRSCTANNCGTHNRRKVAKVPHDFSPATREKPQTCKFKCGTTQGSPLGHSYNPATCVAPKTCRICKKTEGGLGTHNFKKATCTQLATCRVCGITTRSLEPHNYVNGRCSVCGRIESVIADPSTNVGPN